jgi:hypothetical protein
MLSNKKPEIKVQVSYHYHKPESGSIVIYNVGKNKLANLKVVLTNDKGQSFDYKISKIGNKTGELINYRTENALNGLLFNGSIVSVKVVCGSLAFQFKADLNNTFKAY